MIVLANAYSRANKGDGLLVDESLALLHEAAGVEPSDVVVLAHDAPSFADLPRVVATPAASMTPSGIGGLRASVGSMNDLIAEADLVASVGGGFLRFGSRSEAAKSRLSHVMQLESARRSGTPYLLLPQSIGPLRFAPRDLGRVLAGARYVFVRDDTSQVELLDSLGVRAYRVPDLAVQRLAIDGIQRPTAALGDELYVISRDLGDRAFDGMMTALFLRPGTQPVLQSEAGSRNRDGAHYERVAPQRTVIRADEVWSAERRGVVVSVRLHGAIQALLAGLPAVHLSYERKGFGAYSDLGLDRFVVDARSTSLVEVLDRVDEIRADEAAFWAAIESSSSALRESRKRLVSALREEIERVAR